MQKLVLSCLIFIFSNCLTSAQTKFKSNKPMLEEKSHILPGSFPQLKNGLTFQLVEKKNIFQLTKKPKSNSPLIINRDKNGFPTAIHFIQPLQAESRKIGINLFAYLNELSAFLPMRNPSEEFILKNSEVDELGMGHYKMNQVYKGVPLFGHEIIIHSKNGILESMNGSMQATPNIEVNPIISKIEINTNLEKFTESKVIHKSTSLAAKPNIQLVIYYKNNQPILAWKIRYHSNTLHLWETFVNANNGDIIDKISLTCTFSHNHKEFSKSNINISSDADIKHKESMGAEPGNGADLFNANKNFGVYSQGSQYYLIDASQPMFSSSKSSMPNNPVGAIWTATGMNNSPENNNFDIDHLYSNSGTFADKTAVSAHVNGTLAYLYFKTTHDRNSIDGKGGTVISIINVTEKDGSGMDNAFWNGTAMFYGNGKTAFSRLAKSLDVAGHEISHGVIQNTANLVYQHESGALNESFADVFGVLIDRDDWLIGEDIVSSSIFPSGALRSMSDPHNGGTSLNSNGFQPKHINEQYKGNNDNGGVHINSGIPNHAFYLFAISVGKEKAEKIYYRALSNYLTRSSNFKACRYAVEQASSDLYGESELQAAQQAFDAVGIKYNTPPNPGKGAEIIENPGEEYYAYTNSLKTGIYLKKYETNSQAVTLYSQTIKSRVSASDDGTKLVWIGNNNEVVYTTINWQTGNTEIYTFPNLGSDFDNVVISKNGDRIALNKVTQEPYIYVYELNNEGSGKSYKLYNPSYSNAQTGDVKYADAMEFDLTGENIIYDAFNSLNSNFGDDISYWDVGVLNVFNTSTNSSGTGFISKLFTSLPEGESVGNATFAKTNTNIISFDYVTINNDYKLLTANIETNKISEDLFVNEIVNYPSFNKSDQAILFDATYQNSSALAIIGFNKDNLTSTTEASLLEQDARWGTWVASGVREISTPNQNIKETGNFKVFPTLAKNFLYVSFTQKTALDNYKIQIIDLKGAIIKTINQENVPIKEFKHLINLNTLPSGTYFLNLTTPKGTATEKFIKQ